jgi:tetratricopeptide (TPR) repeat protein
MDEREANVLVEAAMARPRDAYERAEAALADPLLSDAVASIALRAMGIAARSVADMARSIDLLRAAGQRAALAGRDELVVSADVSLAGSLYLAGRADEALHALDRAAARAGDGDVANIGFQRATILAREGRLDEAVRLFDDVLDRFTVAGDEAFVASTLGNRGMANLDRGRATAAQRDLEAARHRFAALGVAFKVATMDHNLGRVAGRRGDVVTALDRFAAAEEQLQQLGQDTAEIQANRLEVLLQAGLFEEAASVAAASERSMGRVGLELDRAEVALAHSLALLGQEALAAAVEQAERAATLFAGQRRHAWADEARLVAMRAHAGEGSVVDVAAATAIARSLEAAGHPLAAVQAWSVVATAEPHTAARGVRRLDIRPQDAPLELRLALGEITARERWAAGDRAGAMRATAQAATLGRRQQAALGATDVRAGVSAQLVAIAQLGLTIRREAGRPWNLVRWVDETRGGSLRVSSMVAAAAPQTADLLSRLRALQVESRDPPPERALPLLREQARLQRQLVLAQRSGSTVDQRRHPLPRRLRDVAGSLRIVQYHRDGGRLGAAVIVGSSVEVVELADLGAVERAAAALRVALLRMIGSDGAGGDRVCRCAAQVAGLVLPPADPRPTVIVPLTRHSGLPWSLLPGLDAAPVTVAPTLRHWVHAGDTERGAAPTVALLEGTDVLTSAGEVQRVRHSWTGGRGQVRAAVDDVRGALDALVQADVAHIATHGERRAGGGRFAQLRFRDGDVTAFDLEQLPRAPALVVLSACDAGLVDALPGEESAGLSTALFGRGTRTIIAGTVPVPDSTRTAETFGLLHDHLAAGAPPSVALFEAQRARHGTVDGIVARTISCFGRG